MLKFLINFGFVTSFEDSHYILLFRYIYSAQLKQWFCYSKHLHVNRNYRPNGTATSLSPKCYSANVPLDFCTTADFETKYFLTKVLLAFWVIPNWFSRVCSQNGYLNSKIMLRWDGHFKHVQNSVKTQIGIPWPRSGCRQHAFQHQSPFGIYPDLGVIPILIGCWRGSMPHTGRWLVLTSVTLVLTPHHVVRRPLNGKLSRDL